jgi:hypothetical protein
MAKRNFEVGDRVRVVAKGNQFLDVTGKCGVIKDAIKYNIKGSHLTYVVECDGNPNNIYCWACDIELVSKGTPQITNNIKNTPKVTTITDEQLNRMHKEFTELGERAEKLEKFINDTRFMSVDEQSKTELMIQLDAMKIYYRVLVSRYNRLLTSRTNTTLYMD